MDVHVYDSDEELLRLLDENIRAWRERAEIPADEIALLTPRSAARSALWQVDRLGGVALTDDPWEKGKILRSSIYRFKGLERLVVAMTELDGARDEALYIGFSRASVFLSVFCSTSARRRLPAELVRAGIAEQREGQVIVQRSPKHGSRPSSGADAAFEIAVKVLDDEAT